MAEGENNQQHSSAFLEVTVPPIPSSWFDTDPQKSVSLGSTQASESYAHSDFRNMYLSNVELHPDPPLQEDVPPGPPPMTSVMLFKTECSSRFEKGESSETTKKFVDQIPHTQNDAINLVSNVGDREKKRKQDSDHLQPRKRRQLAQVHNFAERRRRMVIAERIGDLQELIPNCHKTDQASVVSSATEYIKLLQQQLQTTSIYGSMPVPYFPFMPMGPMNMGMGLHSSISPNNLLVDPPLDGSGFQFPFYTTMPSASATSLSSTFTQGQSTSQSDADLYQEKK